MCKYVAVRDQRQKLFDAKLDQHIYCLIVKIID